MNPLFLLLALSKIIGKTSLALIEPPVYKMVNFELKILWMQIMSDIIDFLIVFYI